MEIEFSKLLMKISTVSVLVPMLVLLVLLVRFRRLKKEKVWIAVYICIRALTEYSAFYMAKELGMNNRPLLHVYTIVEFCLLVWIVGRKLPPMVSRKTLVYLLIAFATAGILNGLFGEGFANFNSYFRALEGLLLIGLTLIYFFKTLQDLKIPHIEREPVIWVSFGTILYFSGSLFLFLISNLLDTAATNELSMTIWGIHALLNALFNLFLALALLVRSSDPMPPSRQAFY